jgi:hypothetical protein
MSGANRPSSALSSSGWAGTPQPRRSVTDRYVDAAPLQEPPTTYRLGTAVDKPAWPRPDDEEATPARRSPSLSEGISWLRRQVDQAARKDWGQEASSPGPADDDRDDHHHHHHHGLTGRS